MAKCRYLYLATTLCCVNAPSLNAQNETPNVVIFIADDLGWEDLGAYGNDVIRTPNIDYLANNGMKFNNFYLTTSSSSPSRSSILSGMYPTSTAARNLHDAVPEYIDIFPDRLHEIGYYTMLVGKNHGTTTKKVADRFDYLKPSSNQNMGEDWVKAIKQRPKDQPFFLFAASTDPHRPYNRDDFDQKYSPDDVVVPPYLQDSPEMRDELADYYNEITRFDDHIGLTLDILKEQNVLDNTIIIVMTDNGRPFPQCKTRMNAQGLKSPFIVYYPDVISSATESNSLASAVDIAPTILDVCGVDKSSAMQGFSMMPIFRDPKAVVRKYAFAEHNWHVLKAFERCVITNEYIYCYNWLPELNNPAVAETFVMPAYKRMIADFENGVLEEQYQDCFISPRSPKELFNTNDDIHCMSNLAYKRRYRDVVNELDIALRSWQESIGDFFPGIDKIKQDREGTLRDGSMYNYQ